MPQALPPRSRAYRTYAAIALFLAVYGGVMVIVLAPKDMIAVQSGSAVYDAD